MVIVRDIEMLPHHTLDDLHYWIGRAFDMDNDHLWEFYVGPRRPYVRTGRITCGEMGDYGDVERIAWEVTLEDLKSSLDSVKKKIQDLGYINNMAEDEYNEAKKNYDFYSKNMDDLTKAKNDLECVSDFCERNCPSFYKRDGFQWMFNLPKA